jgi:hypothetical protein
VVDWRAEQYRNSQRESTWDVPRGSGEVQVSRTWLQDDVDDQEEGMMQVHGPDEDVLRLEFPFQIDTEVAQLAELGPMHPWRGRSDSDRIKQK